MPAVKEHLSLRVANLTAFLRFEAGVVQGQEPQEGDSDNEKRLRKQVKDLQSALSDGERRLRDVSIPQHWIWTAYIVSDIHRFVFLANHKVATTSILMSLLPLFDFDEMGKYGDVSLRRDMSFKESAEAVCHIPDEISNHHFRSQYITACVPKHEDARPKV